jgi:hypothetical protein
MRGIGVEIEARGCQVAGTRLAQEMLFVRAIHAGPGSFVARYLRTIVDLAWTGAFVVDRC